MAKGQYKNTIKNNQGNTAPPDPSSPTIASPEYYNTAKAQENNPKSNLVKIIEAFKEEINKSFKEIQKNTYKQVKKMNKTVQDLKMK